MLIDNKTRETSKEIALKCKTDVSTFIDILYPRLERWKKEWIKEIAKTEVFLRVTRVD